MRNPRNDAFGGLTLSTPAKAGVQPKKEESGLLPSQEHSHVPERTCILTRRKGTKDELIRLALAPDGTVHPDVRARAPGRGAWIGVTRPEIDEANARGKLKTVLQRAFKTSDIAYDVSLAKTWTPSHMLLLGNFTTFLEAFSTTDLDGATEGHTVMTLTPGVRFWFYPENSLTLGVDIPVTHPKPFANMFRATYILNF